MSATSVTTADETPDPEAAAKPSRRRKVLVLAGPLALAAILSGLWFSGVLPGLLGLSHKTSAVASAASAGPIFVDLPEMIVNLNASTHRPSYLKLVARLEVVHPEDVERIKRAMPRLQDMFQTYMREMRPEELRGSAGTYRLRQELIARANIAAAPAQVTDVLFTQLLVQ